MSVKKKLSVDDVLNNSQRSKKAFVEERRNDTSEKIRIEQKTAEILFEKHFKNIDKELLEELNQRITKITLAEMVNFTLGKKECPWLNNSDWDCGKSGCVKDGKTHCRTIDFINCPAVNQYFKHEVGRKLAIKLKQQNLKRKKKQKRK